MILTLSLTLTFHKCMPCKLIIYTEYKYLQKSGHQLLTQTMRNYRWHSRLILGKLAYFM